MRNPGSRLRPRPGFPADQHRPRRHRRCRTRPRLLPEVGWRGRAPPDDLLHPECRDKVHKVALRLIDTADLYYASAATGLARLPLRAAMAIGAARAVYRGIGSRLRRLGPSAGTSGSPPQSGRNSPWWPAAAWPAPCRAPQPTARLARPVGQGPAAAKPSCWLRSHSAMAP
jgi:hypothetical protein